jgi:hypothetical protein
MSADLSSIAQQLYILSSLSKFSVISRAEQRLVKRGSCAVRGDPVALSRSFADLVLQGDASIAEHLLGGGSSSPNVVTAHADIQSAAGECQAVHDGPVSLIDFPCSERGKFMVQRSRGTRGGYCPLGVRPLGLVR